MKMTGGDSESLFIRREALLDALEALEKQRDALIVIGAQAVYLRTGDLDVALAPATKDSDFSLDPRALQDDPLIEQAISLLASCPTSNPVPG